jgi:hypothetical protein
VEEDFFGEPAEGAGGVERELGQGGRFFGNYEGEGRVWPAPMELPEWLLHKRYINEIRVARGCFRAKLASRAVFGIYSILDKHRR